MASKLAKSAAGYLSAKLIGTEQIGTKCAKCRDFIPSYAIMPYGSKPSYGGQCRITDPPNVDGEKGTCTYFLKGTPRAGVPLRLVPKEVVGYIEGDDVPTFCGRCEYYSESGRLRGGCEIVEGIVDYGGCCNSYSAKENGRDDKES